MRVQKYVAEFLAVFSLTLAVSLSINTGGMTPVIAAFTLGLFIYTVGAISGAHVNPAITCGLAVMRKIGGVDAIFYVLSQFLGAFVAMYTLSLIGQSVDVTPSASSWDVFAIEALGAFFLAFGVASVVWGKVTQSASGIVIGGSLFLGITIAVAAGSAGILNPAVAFGLGSLDVYYAFGPVAGAVVASALYGGLARDGK